MEKLQYAFVGCSSSDNIDKSFNESTKKVGVLLSNMGFNLVFGACNCGLMGELYRTMKYNNASIIGVAPTLYKDGFKTLQCNEEYIVGTTNERISLMINRADIIIFLAGGTGTLEEIMVALEMKRRKELDKPIIIFDETNFYLPLIQQLTKMKNYGFSKDCDKLFDYIKDETSLNNYLNDYLNSLIIKSK